MALVGVNLKDAKGPLWGLVAVAAFVAIVWAIKGC